MNVSPGAAGPEDIEFDLLETERKGKAVRDISFEHCLKKGQGVFDSVIKLKMETMDYLNKLVMVKNNDHKIIEYKNQSNVITKLLVKALDKDMNLDMENVIIYCLMAIPYQAVKYFLLQAQNIGYLVTVPQAHLGIWLWIGTGNFNQRHIQ